MVCTYNLWILKLLGIEFEILSGNIKKDQDRTELWLLAEIILVESGSHSTRSASEPTAMRPLRGYRLKILAALVLVTATNWFSSILPVTWNESELRAECRRHCNTVIWSCVSRSSLCHSFSCMHFHSCSVWNIVCFTTLLYYLLMCVAILHMHIHHSVPLSCLCSATGACLLSGCQQTPYKFKLKYWTHLKINISQYKVTYNVTAHPYLTCVIWKIRV